MLLCLGMLLLSAHSTLAANIYVVGNFLNIAGAQSLAAAYAVRIQDSGTHYTYSSIGSMGDHGRAVAVCGNDVVLGDRAGGFFLYNGTLHQITTFNDEVKTLYHEADVVYIGGKFTDSSSYTAVASSRLLVWNKTSQTYFHLGGVAFNDEGLAFTKDRTTSRLFFGGKYTVPIQYVGYWDGSSWTDLGAGFNDKVNALAWDSARNRLYAGGRFTTPCSRMAYWNTTDWVCMATNMTNEVDTILLDSLTEAHTVYVCGKFTHIDDTPIPSFCAHWNETGGWQALAGTRNDRVRSIQWRHNPNGTTRQTDLYEGSHGTNTFRVDTYSIENQAITGLSSQPDGEVRSISVQQEEGEGCFVDCDCMPPAACTGGVCAVPTPTASPTPSPTASPTQSPTLSPTASPTPSPTPAPTSAPTPAPTLAPTQSPTASPTSSPTLSPTTSPTPSPTVTPTTPPTTTPTVAPTLSPTASPTPSPTVSPTTSPTPAPTTTPSVTPTTSPTPSPTVTPTTPPTTTPTVAPTLSPTASPTLAPSTSPTSLPTPLPTAVPSMAPTTSPTQAPTLSPSLSPTRLPTPAPTTQPTHAPTEIPTRAPTTRPTLSPTKSPTSTPTTQPSSSPTELHLPPGNPPTGVRAIWNRHGNLNSGLSGLSLGVHFDFNISAYDTHHTLPLLGWRVSVSLLAGPTPVCQANNGVSVQQYTLDVPRHLAPHTALNLSYSVHANATALGVLAVRVNTTSVLYSMLRSSTWSSSAALVTVTAYNTAGLSTVNASVCHDSCSVRSAGELACLRGTCVATSNGTGLPFTCLCPAGFAGPQCSIDLRDGCSPVNPCKNGGVCHTHLDEASGTVTAYCDCSPVRGWTGPACDIDIDECQLGQHQCDPLTQCVNAAGSYTCTECPLFYHTVFAPPGTGRHSCVRVITKCTTANHTVVDTVTTALTPHFVVSELGDTVQCWASLSRSTSGTVNVRLGANGTSSTEVAVVPSHELVFTPSTWNVWQPFTVSGVRDNVTDGDQVVCVEAHTASAAPGNPFAKLHTPCQVLVGNTDIPFPTVDSVSPTAVPLEGPLLTLQGKNFAAGMVVTVGSLPCAPVVVNVVAGMFACVVPNVSGLVPSWEGTYQTLHITTPINASYTCPFDCPSTSQLFFTDSCPIVGQYGSGLDCQPCPLGAVCPGGYRVWPKEGYWIESEFSPPSMLAPCPEPKTARCVGGRFADCRAGYVGKRCADCALEYFRAGSHCLPCSSAKDTSEGLLAACICLSFFCAASSVIVFGSDTVTNMATDALVVCQQAIVVGSALGQGLSPRMEEIYLYLRALALDWQFIKPECRVGKVPFIAVWAAYLVITGMITALFCTAALVYQWRMKERNDERWIVDASHPRVFRAALMAYHISYIVLLGKTLQLVHCTTVSGQLQLVVEPVVRCYQGDHLTAASAGWLLVCFYFIVPPIWMFRELYQFYSGQVIVTPESRRVFSKHWDYLFHNLKKRFYWYRLAAYGFSFTLVALSTFVPTMDGIILSTCAVMGVEFLLAIYARPGAAKFNNQLILTETTVSFLAMGVLYFTVGNSYAGNRVLAAVLGIIVAAYVGLLFHVPTNPLRGDDEGPALVAQHKHNRVRIGRATPMHPRPRHNLRLPPTSSTAAATAVVDKEELCASAPNMAGGLTGDSSESPVLSESSISAILPGECLEAWPTSSVPAEPVKPAAARVRACADGDSAPPIATPACEHPAAVPLQTPSPPTEPVKVIYAVDRSVIPAVVRPTAWVQTPSPRTVKISGVRAYAADHIATPAPVCPTVRVQTPPTQPVKSAAARACAVDPSAAPAPVRPTVEVPTPSPAKTLSSVVVQRIKPLPVGSARSVPLAGLRLRSQQRHNQPVYPVAAPVVLPVPTIGMQPNWAMVSPSLGAGHAPMDQFAPVGRFSGTRSPSATVGSAGSRLVGVPPMDRRFNRPTPPMEPRPAPTPQPPQQRWRNALRNLTVLTGVLGQGRRARSVRSTSSAPNSPAGMAPIRRLGGRAARRTVGSRTPRLDFPHAPVHSASNTPVSSFSVLPAARVRRVQGRPPQQSSPSPRTRRRRLRHSSARRGDHVSVFYKS